MKMILALIFLMFSAAAAFTATGPGTVFLPGVRNSGMAGSGLAMIPSLEAMYLNPAGLADTEQSVLNQALRLDRNGSAGFSQSLLIHLDGFPRFGGGFVLNPRSGKSVQPASFTWFVALRLFRIFSLGAASDPGSEEKNCRLGGVMSIPLHSILSRIAIGWMSRGIDLEKIPLHRPFNGGSPSTAVGTHLRLGSDASIALNLTADTMVLEDGRGRRFGTGTSRFGAEETFAFHRFEFSGRIGAVVRPGTRTLFAGGAGVRFDFLEFNASVAETPAGHEYLCSVLYRLGSRAIRATNRTQAPADVPSNDPAVMDYEEIPLSFGGVNDGASRRFIFLVDLPREQKIDYWHLCLMDSTGAVVHSFEALGRPPKGIIYGYENLPEGLYRADLTVIVNKGARVAGRRISLVRDPDNLVVAAKKP